MDELTDRELQVLAELVKGRRNRQIAEALFIGEETVKSHMSSILRKLHVTSRAEAISRVLNDAMLSRQVRRAASEPPLEPPPAA